jgi:hypothetical protein
MSAELSSLYKNKPLVLWVEDELTRSYLRAIWTGAPDVALLVAGGGEAVPSVVRDARSAGHANVFGLRDRDFGVTNQTNWLNPNSGLDVFIPKAHEIENFFLDFPGLGALGPSHNRRRHPAATLESRVLNDARNRLWWMAARATIADVRADLTHDFPRHPSAGNPPPNSLVWAQQQVEGALLNSTWGARVPSFVAGLDRDWIAERLQHHAATLGAELNSPDWRWRWSGKELWKPLPGLLGCAEADLVKALAAYQVSKGCVDTAFADLDLALRKRSGLVRW